MDFTLSNARRFYLSKGNPFNSPLTLYTLRATYRFYSNTKGKDKRQLKYDHAVICWGQQKKTGTSYQ